MSTAPGSSRASAATTRFAARLRARLEAARRGEALDAEAALADLERLERIEGLLRRTALHGFGQFEQRVGELSLVTRVGGLFAAVFDESRLCDALLDLVEDALPCTHAFLWLREPGSEHPALRSLAGPELEEGALEAARRAAELAGPGPDPLWIADVEDRPEIAGLDGGLRGSLLACPLVAQGEVLGALVVSEPRPGALREDHGRVLRPIADLSALAVRHARACARNLTYQRDLERIVEQRTREVNEARSALSRQERVAAMGKLAASIAHEVNNPMSFLVSNLERAAEYADVLESALPVLQDLVAAGRELPDSADPRLVRARTLATAAGDGRALEHLATVREEMAAVIAEAREGTDRIRRVGHDLRSFAQGVAGVAESVDVNRLVETALHIVRAEAKDRVVFDCRYGILPEVRCQRYQITQVLLNLLQNAVDAVQGAGTVRVTTRVVGEMVEVEVVDDGPGVASEDAERIFEPFYTTRIEGSGLGLSISRDIATVHRGVLEVTPGPEGGVFSLRIPIAGPGGTTPPVRFEDL